MENLKIILKENNTLEFFEKKYDELKYIKDFDQKVLLDLEEKINLGN